MPGDVLEEAPLGLALAHDAGDVGPEVSRVGSAEALSGDGERLARIPAMNHVNESSPPLGIETLEIVPNGSPLKDSVRHPGEEDVLREPFDLDVADGAVLGLGDAEAEIEAGDPATEGEPIHRAPRAASSRSASTCAWFTRNRFACTPRL